MIWIKLGILIIGFIYAGFIPLTLRKVLRRLAFNLREETLSFLSDKRNTTNALPEAIPNCCS